MQPARARRPDQPDALATCSTSQRQHLTTVWICNTPPAIGSPTSCATNCAGPPPEDHTSAGGGGTATRRASSGYSRAQCPEHRNLWAPARRRSRSTVSRQRPSRVARHRCMSPAPFHPARCTGSHRSRAAPPHQQFPDRRRADGYEARRPHLAAVLQTYLVLTTSVSTDVPPSRLGRTLRKRRCGYAMTAALRRQAPQIALGSRMPPRKWSPDSHLCRSLVPAWVVLALQSSRAPTCAAQAMKSSWLGSSSVGCSTIVSAPASAHRRTSSATDETSPLTERSS